MAYAARQTETQRFATIGIVLLVHVALGVFLVKEFAPGLIDTIVPRSYDPILDFTPKKTDPPPPKTDPKPARSDTVIVAPTQAIQIDTTPVEVTIDPIRFNPPDFSDGLTGPSRVGDGLQKPGITPRRPSPANDQSNWVKDTDYPDISIKFREHGISVFRATVGTDGRVKACEIVSSSGFRRLDEAACRLVASRARFDPATDRSGAKVVGTYSNSVLWRLPN